MNEARVRIADRMARDMVDYLAAEVFPGVVFFDAVWTSMEEPDRRMMHAIGEYERGALSFPELEAEGVRYVEAWTEVLGRVGQV